MAEVVKLVAEKREGSGKIVARKLRRQGKLPGVLYGHKEETLSLTLPREDVERAIRHGSRLVDLSAGGKVEKALVREVQWDHLGRELLHVDFYRVSADERVVVTVPIELRGTAPGIAAGGVLDQPMHRLSIECLAVAMPESIRVNVGELQLGQAIHVKELTLPAGVKAMAEPDAVVVHVTQKAEEAAAGEAATAAEPEVIGRQKAEEDEAE